MKNFRKVLALVLVVATLFSFTAMASAKSLSDYTDADSVNYAPAVDILSTLGILNGYEDDSFKPTNTITREEMAKMIAVLANSGSDVSTLYATACTFADVSKDHWSASYVAYCAKTGIVAGRSATTFDPKGKVTGLETAKMLLVTMGFDAEKQGYVGSDWKVNVLRDAKNCGLLGNFAASYDVDAAITREEAAQMMLNALNAQVVIGYVSNNILTITNTAYKKWDGTLIDATKLTSNKWAMYGNAIIAESTLAQALYGASFSKEAVYDCYGRPGFYWSFTNSKGNEATNKTFFAETLTAKYTTSVDFSSKLSAEYKSETKDYTVIAFVDGKKQNIDEDLSKDGLKALEANIGKGTVTEIYVNDATSKVTVVIINTYIGYVTATTKNANTFYVNYNGTKLSSSNKAHGFEQDDVILYWVCNGAATINTYTAQIHDAEIAPTAVGTVTRATTVSGNPAKSNVTVDGTVYEYAKNFGNYCRDLGNKIPMGTEAINNDYIVYLDKTGYIMGYEEAPVDYDITYAYAVERSGYCKYYGATGAGDAIYDAARDMVYYDGKYTEDVAVTLGTWDTVSGNQTQTGEGTLLRYTTDSSDRAAIVSEAARLNNSYTLNKNGNLTDGTNTIYGSNETMYMVRTWDYANQTDVYTVYAYGELPSSFTSMTGNVQYFAAYNGNTNLTYASYVFFDAAFAKTSLRAFVIGYDKSVTDSNFTHKFGLVGAYDAYVAIIDGEEAILAVGENDTILDSYKNNDGTICGLFTLGLKCLGLEDDGTPVYAAVNVVDVTTYVALRVWNGQIQYKENGKWVSKALDENAFGVATTPAGYSYDDGVTYVTYAILKDATAINNYYESAIAMGVADDSDLFFPGAAWIIDTDGDGDIDEVYFNVYDGYDPYGTELIG